MALISSSLIRLYDSVTVNDDDDDDDATLDKPAAGAAGALDSVSDVLDDDATLYKPAAGAAGARDSVSDVLDDEDDDNTAEPAAAAFDMASASAADALDSPVNGKADEVSLLRFVLIYITTQFNVKRIQ